MFKCICNREFLTQNGLNSHKGKCSVVKPDYISPSSNPNYKNPMQGKIAWNKGLTKETDDRVAQYSNKLKGQVNFDYSPSNPKEIERRLKLSRSVTKAGTGGYKPGSGRGKQGWYKGIHCDSSWELAYLVYHLDHNLYIERCKEKRQYVWNNKQHTYYPDFITDNGIIEIKGYSTDQWKSKEEQNPDVKVLYKNEIKPYLDYVINTYGTDFIKLYDGYNPKLDLKNHTYVWVHNEKENHMIKTNLYDEYINKGFIRGRKQFNKIIN